jgi:XisH protein
MLIRVRNGEATNAAVSIGDLTNGSKDLYHDGVRRGLEKQQWKITDDPLRFKFGEVNFQVDLAAERILAAERGNEKISVEIKSFLNPSAVTDFYGALEPFLSYRLVLENTEPERLIYLAIPLEDV